MPLLDADAAAFYDRHFVPAIFGKWAPLVVDAASLAPGDRVLDVACGTGVVAREAARRLGERGRVVGLDASACMLDRARAAAPGVEWREGDAAALPFPDESFDDVLCQAALMFLPDRVGALREMRRVLRPGGTLVVQTFGASEAYDEAAAVLEEVAGREVADVFRAPFALADARTVTALVAEAGFGTVEHDTHRVPATFASIEDFVRTEIEGWILKGLVDPAAVLPRMRERLARFVAPDGRVELPMEGHVVAAARALGT